MSTILYIEPTDKTPLIVFDNENNKYEIIGVSIPQDATQFYKPVLEWLGSMPITNESIEFVINLDYFNISSSKMILFILYKLQELNAKGALIVVKWFYNDEELLEAGEDYQFISKLKFEFVETSKEYLVQ